MYEVRIVYHQFTVFTLWHETKTTSSLAISHIRTCCLKYWNSVRCLFFLFFKYLVMTRHRAIVPALKKHFLHSEDFWKRMLALKAFFTPTFTDDNHGLTYNYLIIEGPESLHYVCQSEVRGQRSAGYVERTCNKKLSSAPHSLYLCVFNTE